MTFRNRVWVPPMCQYAIEDQNGVPGSWHLVHLGAFARGGAGLVIAEASAVSPIGRICPQDVGIWNDEQRDAWVPVVDFIHSQGARAGIQLSHAGRKASEYRPWDKRKGTTRALTEGGWQTFAPSAIAFEGFAVPQGLSLDGVREVVDQFTAAARRAAEAGFDVIELHAAHGYLLHEFLSPLSNVRTDDYGGSLENRARLLLDVITATKAAIGDEILLFVRLSATDYVEGGWNEEECAIVVKWAQQAGGDFFDISSGGLVPGVRIELTLGYQVKFAEHIKHQTGAPVSAVGLISESRQAEAIVASGQADAVMIGREIMRDPSFPLRAAFELGFSPDYWPDPYLRAKWERRIPHTPTHANRR